MCIMIIMKFIDQKVDIEIVQDTKLEMIIYYYFYM